MAVSDLVYPLIFTYNSLDGSVKNVITDTGLVFMGYCDWFYYDPPPFGEYDLFWWLKLKLDPATWETWDPNVVGAGETTYSVPNSKMAECKEFGYNSLPLKCTLKDTILINWIDNNNYEVLDEFTSLGFTLYEDLSVTWWDISQ